MQLIDPAHPFYKPLWVRLLIVGSCSGWAIFEAIGGDPFFMIIMGALAIYSARVLLIMYKPPADPDVTEKTPENASASDDAPTKPDA